MEPRECAAGSATTSALALAAVAPQKRPAPAAGVGAAGAKRQRGWLCACGSEFAALYVFTEGRLKGPLEWSSKELVKSGPALTTPC